MVYGFDLIRGLLQHRDGARIDERPPAGLRRVEASKEISTMTAPDSVLPHALAEDHLAAASPDLLRAMVETFRRRAHVRGGRCPLQRRIRAGQRRTRQPPQRISPARLEGAVMRYIDRNPGTTAGAAAGRAGTGREALAAIMFVATTWVHLGAVAAGPRPGLANRQRHFQSCWLRPGRGQWAGVFDRSAASCSSTGELAWSRACLDGSRVRARPGRLHPPPVDGGVRTTGRRSPGRQGPPIPHQ